MRSIRKATLDDLELMQKMYENSRLIMQQNGNPTQWGTTSPSLNQVIMDIAKEQSYLVTDGDTPVATFAFIHGDDPTYKVIEGGKWLDSILPYATIHRVAKMPGTKGVMKSVLDYCQAETASLRIDTHENNTIMLGLLERSGFSYCGIIHIADGSERRAFQKLSYPEIPIDLQSYVEENIIPQYLQFDKAHRISHVRSVLNNSFPLAKNHKANLRMAYVVAAYHDLGLSVDREFHHLHSGKILRNDIALRFWFDEAQIEEMAQAVEDHRASRKESPRSIYGMIVAEADRDIQPLDIIRRTIQYGLSHYSYTDKDSHWIRTVEHLREKYSEQGYLKLWLEDSPNVAPLEELRRIISDQEALKAIFEKIYCEESGSMNT